MNNQKSRFWTFLFSLVPGAGEMYFGLYRQGLSIMGYFWGAFAVAAWAQFVPVACVMPVVWMYSFFHVHNLRRMRPEEFQKQEDRLLIPEALLQRNGDVKIQKIVAGALILLGAMMLFDAFLSAVWYFLPEVVWYIQNAVTRLVFGGVIIAVGVHLLRGSRAAVERQEQARQYIQRPQQEEEVQQEDVQDEDTAFVK